MKSFHDHCSFCGEQGLIIHDYQVNRGSIRTEITIDHRHEGWPGIPHGGIAMTALVELADLLDQVTGEYPMQTNFRFGGDKLILGDRISISLTNINESYRGEINKISGVLPYMTGTLVHRYEQKYEEELSALERLIKRPYTSKNIFTIPDFVHRILFKREFQYLHRSREFEFRELPDGRMYMLCFFKNSRGEIQQGELNLISEEQVHPGALLTMLDETLAWSGFLRVWQGGVTVSLMSYFLRPVNPHEQIFSMGICDSVRGSHRRKMITCSGGIFSVTEKRIEPVVFARGKWLTKPEFKDEMIRFLLAEESSRCVNSSSQNPQEK
jgi:acyl-coenzyme A thioesterase PaaI-like protein